MSERGTWCGVLACPPHNQILRLAILWYERSFSRMAETSEDGTPQVQRIYQEPQPP
jgi:hypothetical protein